jgi:outer membrane receptor protein involved in Fe transport
MRPNSKISATVAAILSAPAATTVVLAAPADQPSATTAAAPGNELQEVIVTANRREQNLQDVPISIQALTGSDLQKLNVATLEDYVKYLPNVSTGSLGPGQGTVFMRGLSVGVLGTQGQGSVGGFPNVAVYLDDQSAQLPGRNLDIYAADLERIEVLEGPQGTLFGAGAQAGVIRYITNKPKLNATEANFDAGFGTTAHGNDNSNVTAVLNLPLIADTLAVRGVFYTDSRGGYIDNVPSTFTRAGTDLGLAAENGGVVPANNPTWNNYNIAGNKINPVTYQGLRMSLLWKINDSWDALLQQTYQNMDAQGVFYEMPNGSEGTQISAAAVPFGGQPLGPLQVTLFQPNYDRDRFENTALTVTGRIADLKLVYAGSYLVRNIDQVQDYTNYSRGRYAYYYQCVGVSYSKTAGGANASCYSPLDTWHDNERNTHLSQELRLSLPDDWRLRGLVGLFYEDYKIDDDTAWLYRTVPDCSAALPDNCFHPLQPLPGGGFNNPNVRNSDVGFNDDFQRQYTQRAAFTSIDFDIIPKVLTITGGTRYYHIDNQTRGGDLSSFGCKEFSATNTYFGPCTIPHELKYGTNLNTQIPNTTKASGFRSRANLSWHVTPDQLLYVTWSQGYRAGGFNRGTASVLPDANGIPQYIKPGAFASDDLTNKEIGWKTEWLDHHLLINGAVYKENWNNVQTGLFCPTCGLGNLTFGVNGPDYEVKGVELQVNWLVMTGLSVTGSASWNSSELSNSPALLNNNPASPTFGQAIHLSGNLYGNPGSPLADSPPFQTNLRARYAWDWNGYQPFVQGGFQHQSHSLSATGYVATFDQPAWTTYDLTMGLSKDAWIAQLVGTNITDVNKSLFTSARQWIVTETPMRPRTIELRVSYSFQNK